MPWRFGKSFCWTMVLLLGWAGSSPAAHAAEARLAQYKTAALAIAEQSIRGAELAGKVIEQQDRAQENCKKLFGGSAVPHRETDHFLLYGKVPGKTLKEVGDALEKQFALARKTLKMPPEDPWPGKLAVYLFTQRSKFASFLRSVEKRRPESDDQGSFQVRGDFPHVAAGPALEDTGGPPLEIQVAEQLGAALLSLKAGKSVPDWIVAGFGRATYYRAGPPAEFTQEKRRAVRAIAPGAVSAMAVWNGTLRSSEAAIIRASLVDFLAYGPGRSKFVLFLEAFKPEDGATTKTAEDALKAASMSPTVVNRRWKAWARKGK